MSKQIIEIKPERALLQYLYARLRKGITDGISEEEYFAFLKKLNNMLQTNLKEYIMNITCDNLNFSHIVIDAIHLTCENQKKTIEHKFENIHKLVVYPTYHLKKTVLEKCKLFSDPCLNFIVDEFLEENVKRPQLSNYKFTDIDQQKLEIAKNIGALYVNQLIYNYFKHLIMSEKWPLEYNNIDKYIFEDDLSYKFKSKKGLQKTFKQTYLQAINVILEMLDDPLKAADIIHFSNNPENVLAYANFMKIIAPEKLAFLTDYTFNKNSFKELVNVDIYDGIATHQLYYTDKQEYKELEERREYIDDSPKKLMEKRIGYIKF